MVDFNREKFQKLLHDAGGAFADRATAERAIRDCGGEVKKVGPRVVEREGGHVVRKGECVEMVTDREEARVLDERKIKQEFQHEKHLKQNYTVNGPHEFIEYVPIGEKPVQGTKYKKK